MIKTIATGIVFIGVATGSVASDEVTKPQFPLKCGLALNAFNIKANELAAKSSPLFFMDLLEKVYPYMSVESQKDELDGLRAQIDNHCPQQFKNMLVQKDRYDPIQFVPK